MLFDHKLAWTDEKIYKEIYNNSISNPNEFWLYHSQMMYWKEKPREAYSKDGKWLEDGVSNICYNCVDRHAIMTPNKTAIVWHGDEVNERREVSYSELLQLVIEISSILKNQGISKGDVVGIYMPTRIESIAAMLACSRIGAIHLVIFAGFSATAIAYRLEMANARIILTMTSSRRGGKEIHLKSNIDEAVSKMSYTPKILLFDDYKNLLNGVPITDEIEWCSNKDNLFILYTSGSTGKPKGIIHSSLRYMLYTSTTFKFIFNIKKDDIYFCTSDIGWITGHSYIAYAPFFHGNTIVIFEGNPTYPDASRYWDIIEREKVNIFYTAPTAIRSLKLFNKNYVTKHDLSSLRVLGSVGEPINKDAWEWYFNMIGNNKCPIIDTWWQTETGGVILAPLLNVKNQKPGFAAKPFFGIIPKIIDNKLYIQNKWPGVCRSVTYECEYSEKDENNGSCKNRFDNEYFENDLFKTGDGALYDEDFDIKVIGRLDDVINISGHRLSAAELEDAVHSVDGVKDCAVVAVDHEIKGQSAFVYVSTEKEFNRELAVKAILSSIRKNIGPIAKPDFITFIEELPKTRSGKIVRHILRDLAQGKSGNSKDISSVANLESLDKIKAAVKNTLDCPDLCLLR